MGDSSVHQAVHRNSLAAVRENLLRLASESRYVPSVSGAFASSSSFLAADPFNSSPSSSPAVPSSSTPTRVPPSIVNAQDREGRTALFIAASLGYKDIVESLVEEFGASIEMPNVDGLTPLHVAAGARQYAVVEFLLNRRANASAVTSDGSTLLHLLAENLSSDRRERSDERTQAENIVRRVVRETASAIDAQRDNGDTPLHIAVASQSVHTVKFLLSGACKASPNVKNRSSDTPFLRAVYQRYYHITALLLLAGANAELTGSRGTAKRFALLEKDPILTDLLADPATFQKVYETPTRLDDGEASGTGSLSITDDDASTTSRASIDMEEFRQSASLTASSSSSSSSSVEARPKAAVVDEWTLVGEPEQPASQEVLAEIDDFVDIPYDHSYLAHANLLTYFRSRGKDFENSSASLRATWKIENASELPKSRDAVSNGYKKLIRKGVPDNFRRAVWMAVTGTNDIYLASNHDHWNRAQLFAFGPERIMPGHGYDIASKLFGCEHFSFNDHCLSLEGETWVKRLLCVLIAMNADIDHCTPLPDALCFLTLYMSEGDAFLTTMTMLQESRMRRWYFNLGPRLTQLFYLTFDGIIQKKFSNIYDVMTKLNITSQDFAMLWFERLFVSAVPYHSALFIFDAFLNEGSKILYRAGLAILGKARKFLVESQTKSHFLSVLSHIAAQMNIVRLTRSMDRAYSLYLSRSHFAALDKENEWKTSHILAATSQHFYTPHPKPRASTVITPEMWERIYQHFPSRMRISDPYLVYSQEDGYTLTGLLQAAGRVKGYWPYLIVVKTTGVKPIVLGCYSPVRWEYKGDLSYGHSPEPFLFCCLSKPERVPGSDGPLSFFHVNPECTPEQVQELGLSFQVVNITGLFMGIDQHGTAGLFLDNNLRFGRTGSCYLFGNPPLVQPPAEQHLDSPSITTSSHSGSMSGSSDFEIAEIELWTFH